MRVAILNYLNSTQLTLTSLLRAEPDKEATEYFWSFVSALPLYPGSQIPTFKILCDIQDILYFYKQAISHSTVFFLYFFRYLCCYVYNSYIRLIATVHSYIWNFLSIFFPLNGWMAYWHTTFTDIRDMKLYLWIYHRSWHNKWFWL